MTTTGTAEFYRCFTHIWWRRPSWPDGREMLATHCTEDEARRICQQYNDTHAPGFLSRNADFEVER